jgi:hypothetical protein
MPDRNGSEVQGTLNVALYVPAFAVSTTPSKPAQTVASANAAIEWIFHNLCPTRDFATVNTKFSVCQLANVFRCEAEIRPPGRRLETMRRPEATRSRQPHRHAHLRARRTCASIADAVADGRRPRQPRSATAATGAALPCPRRLRVIASGRKTGYSAAW